MVMGANRTLRWSTHDVGWGQFITILHSKAAGAGVRVIAVPPANTTQQCSACGALPETPEQRKTLGDRVHRCPSCGYVADRDVNAQCVTACWILHSPHGIISDTTADNQTLS
jgi:putative transposase